LINWTLLSVIPAAWTSGSSLRMCRWRPILMLNWSWPPQISLSLVATLSSPYQHKYWTKSVNSTGC
jgi:hypothetical protein